MSPQPLRRHRPGRDAARARADKIRARSAGLLRTLCAPALVICSALLGAHGASAGSASPTPSEGPATVSFSGASEPQAGAAQQPVAAPQTGPTPYVRPRTVGPRGDANGAGARPEKPQTTGDAPADDGAPEEVGEDEVVRVNSNLVIIPASVKDGRGQAVTDLRVEDFELRVDEEVQPITDLSRAETPVSVTMLFDNSSSLSAAREFEKQAAVRFFRSIIRPVDRAAVYAISTTPTLAQPLTSDVNRLVSTIERFGKPDGATALFDAVAQASDYMFPVAGRKVLVLVSDGTDTVSDVAFEEAVNRALRAECQVYVVQTRQVEEPNLRDLVSEERMQKLSEQTGGAVFIPKSIEDLDRAFAQIALDLSQQYLLSYYPQQGRRDNYFRFIKLNVKSRPNLRVRARKGFYPLDANGGAHAAPRSNEAAAPVSIAARNSAVTTPARGGRPARPSAGDAARSAQTRPVPRADAPGRRTGPAGPSEEEGARPPQAARLEETTTMTLRVAESSPRAAETAYSPAAEPSPTPTPAPTPAPQFFKPAPAAQPATEGATTAPSPAPAPTPKPEAEGASGSQPREAAGEKKVVSGGVLNAKALSLPRPSYPPPARSAGVYGVVTVSVTVDEKGRVVEAKAVSGPPLLHGAAITAARQARFSPTVQSGSPVRMTGTISYNFMRQ